MDGEKKRMGEDRALRARRTVAVEETDIEGLRTGDEVQLRNPLMGVDHVLRACTTPQHNPCRQGATTYQMQPWGLKAQR